MKNCHLSWTIGRLRCILSISTGGRKRITGMKAGKYWKTGVGISVLLIAAMTGAARYFGRHELFFPELLAMAMGCFWMEKRPWRTSRPLLFLSLTLGGCLGYGLTFVPGLGVSEKMLIGYALCGVWLAFRRINVTPMLSACLLPLLLEGATWLYPVAIASQMALLCGLEWLLERRGLRPRVPFDPLEGDFPELLWRWGKLTALLCILLWTAHWAGRFAAIPPLIVAYSAFADLYRPARKHYWLGVGFCAFAAPTGVLGCRYGMAAGIPEPLTVALLTVLLAVSCRRLEYFLPPCGALLLLPFLLPEAALGQYLWQAPVGAVLFLGAGRLFSLREERRDPPPVHLPK